MRAWRNGRRTALRTRRGKSRVGSTPIARTNLAPVDQLAGVAALKTRTVFVQIEPGAPCLLSPIGRGNRLKPGQVWDRGPQQAPCALSSEEEHRFYTARVEISKFSARTICASSSAEERRFDTPKAASSILARRTILPCRLVAKAPAR